MAGRGPEGAAGRERGAAAVPGEEALGEEGAEDDGHREHEESAGGGEAWHPALSRDSLKRGERAKG